VETRIYKLEFKSEMTRQAAGNRGAAGNGAQSLSGNWRVRDWTNPAALPVRDSKYWGSIDEQASFSASVDGGSFEGRYQTPNYSAWYRGTISENTITGQVTNDVCPPVRFEGTIDYAENVIVLATEGTYWVNNDNSCRYDSSQHFGSLLLLR